MLLAKLGEGSGDGAWARFRRFDQIVNSVPGGSAKKCGLRRKV